MATTTDSGCVPNIGPRERRRRVQGGIIMLGATVALAGVLLGSGAPRVWRTLILLPAAGAFLGFFQANAQTCVALAARGTKNMDLGDEPVADSEMLARMREQSRKVYRKTLLAAVIVTAIALAV